MKQILSALQLERFAHHLGNERLPSYFAVTDLAVSTIGAVGCSIASLVQMSCGIARAGMSWAKQDQPTPLPVQALDHATGYLMAAAVIRAISSAINGNGLRNARLSLARTAELLMMHLQTGTGKLATQITSEDFSDAIENTPWGQAKRLKPAISIKGTPMQWSCPACKLGTSLPGWLC